MAYRAILLSDSEFGVPAKSKGTTGRADSRFSQAHFTHRDGSYRIAFVYTDNTSSFGELIIIGSRRTSGTTHVICIRWWMHFLLLLRYYCCKVSSCHHFKNHKLSTTNIRPCLGFFTHWSQNCLLLGLEILKDSPWDNKARHMKQVRYTIFWGMLLFTRLVQIRAVFMVVALVVLMHRRCVPQ